ncbi:MAG: efflux RND transporter periplasmic adaptor subunit [bacterium]
MLKNVKAKFLQLIHLPKWILAIIVILLFVVGRFAYTRIKTSTATPEYQTADVTEGNLVVSLSSSGKVLNNNITPVTTSATGVVKTLYIKEGDVVKQGQKLAEIELDSSGKQQYNSAMASYLGAKNSVASAENSRESANSAMWAAHEKFMGDAVSRSLAPEDPTFIQQQSDWNAAEGKYKTSLSAITQAKISLSASWLAFQESSPIIYAPITGKITGLTFLKGSVISSSSGSSTTSSSTKLANIVNESLPTISLSLSEIDVIKVHVGDKATVIVDAFPDQTFTGKVESIDTAGAVSSGVTTYSVLLSLDLPNENILPNMGTTASIITAFKNNVLIVPNGAIKTTNGVSTVSVLKGKTPTTVTVETGLSSDTSTEITSGLSVGDKVVTGTVSTAPTSTTQTQSVFSVGNRGFGGGTSAVRAPTGR